MNFEFWKLEILKLNCVIVDTWHLNFSLVLLSYFFGHFFFFEFSQIINVCNIFTFDLLKVCFKLWENLSKHALTKFIVEPAIVKFDVCYLNIFSMVLLFVHRGWQPFMRVGLQFFFFLIGCGRLLWWGGVYKKQHSFFNHTKLKFWMTSWIKESKKHYEVEFH